MYFEFDWRCWFIVAALTQMLAVGGAIAVAQAVGQGESGKVSRILNQFIELSSICRVLVTALTYMFASAHMNSPSAHESAVEGGVTFIAWTAPGYTLTVLSAVLSSALRGTGIVKPMIVFHLGTVLINVVLHGSPVPSFRGSLFMRTVVHCHGVVEHVSKVGSLEMPADGDRALFLVSKAPVYYTMRNLGASAQAGLELGRELCILCCYRGSERRTEFRIERCLTGY